MFLGVQGVFSTSVGSLVPFPAMTAAAASTAQYEVVSTGTTGHAESVRIDYDPHIITSGRPAADLLLSHHGPDPTQPTISRRRDAIPSEIFATTPEQIRIAKAYIAQLDQAKVFPRAIVTKVEQDSGFYPAEAYHQNYLTLYPDSLYITTFDLPKVTALQKIFPAEFRLDPVLETRQSS